MRYQRGVQLALASVGKLQGQVLAVIRNNHAAPKHQMLHHRAGFCYVGQRHRGACLGCGSLGGAGLCLLLCLAPGAVFRQVVNDLLHKAALLARAEKQRQLVTRAGHPHIKQAAILLVLANFIGGLAGNFGAGGQHAVDGIQQKHPVVFQPLAGMDGGQNQRRTVVCVLLQHHLQALQPPRQQAGYGQAFAQLRQNFQLAGVHGLLLQIFAVAQLLGQKAHGVAGVHPGQAGKPVGDILRLQAQPMAYAVRRAQRLPHRAARAAAFLTGVLRLHAGNRHAELVVHPHKNLGVAGIIG